MKKDAEQVNHPSSQELNKLRKEGFRPGVVACCVYNKNILFFYKKEYQEWQLPQGGIENNETLDEAVFREMTEELGQGFVSKFLDPLMVVGEDSLEFPKQHHGVKELKTDEGEEVLMKGKHYYFTVIGVSSPDVNISDTEFNDYFWLPYNQALYIANQSKAINKKKLVIKVLERLRELDFID